KREGGGQDEKADEESADSCAPCRHVGFERWRQRGQRLQGQNDHGFTRVFGGVAPPSESPASISLGGKAIERASARSSASSGGVAAAVSSRKWRMAITNCRTLQRHPAMGSPFRVIENMPYCD